MNQVDYDSFQMTVGLDADHEDGLNGALSQLFLFLVEQGMPPHEIREGASLEQAYLRLTGEDSST